MTAGFLTKLIEGRAALPVRAIPYVTGWVVSPEAVASNLGGTVQPEYEQFRNVCAYHRLNGRLVQVNTGEWSEFSGRIATRDQDRVHAAWRAETLVDLPAGAFVWLDDFKEGLRLCLLDDKVTYLAKHRRDNDLVFTPLLPPGAREIALEGFEADPDFDAGEDRRLVDEENEPNEVSHVSIIDPKLRESFGDVPFPARDGSTKSPNSVDGYRSLTAMLEGHLGDKFVELPAEAREHIESHGLLKGLWNQISEDQKRQQAAVIDYVDHPARAKQQQALTRYAATVKLLEFRIQWMETSPRTSAVDDELLALRPQLESAQILLRQARGEFHHPQEASARDDHGGSASSPSLEELIPLERAVDLLSARYQGTTKEALAMWVCVGPEDERLPAYFRNDELGAAVPFQYEINYEAVEWNCEPLLARWWFRQSDLADFQPLRRYITSEALTKRLVEKHLRVSIEEFIRARIEESQLHDLHPLCVATQWSERHAWYPPAETAMFRLCEVEAIEAIHFGKKAIATAAAQDPATEISPDGTDTAQKEMPAAGARITNSMNIDVDRDAVMRAFAVKPHAGNNEKYWDDKLSEAPNWLAGAMTFRGRRGISSRWDPLLVAHALLHHKAMNLQDLDSAMRKHFPGLLAEWKEQTGDQR